MNESLALSELVKRLEKRNEQEAAAIIEIEEKKLRELSERLSERLNSELSTIEDDMSQKLQSFTEKLSKARSEIIENEKGLLRKVRSQQKEIKAQIEETDRQLMQIVSKSQLKRLLYPTLIGIAVVAGLAIGTYALGKYLGHLTQQINKLQETRKQIEAYENVKVYDDGITIPREPKVFQTKDGDWAVIWREN